MNPHAQKAAEKLRNSGHLYEAGNSPLIWDIEAIIQSAIDADRAERERWIPCSERMPEESEGWLIAFTLSGFQDSVTATKIRGDTRYYTHWRLLPPPPQPEPGDE